LARLTHRGDYRPLKAAPTLVRGWRIEVSDVTALAEVLHGFYPGSVADWWAAQSDSPPTTDYASFTQRQTGMYRSTAGLPPERVAEVVSACCSAASCLKRRLWTAPGEGQDGPETKSVIPCLEPCAVLLELARVAAKLDQQPKRSLLLTAAELDTLRYALEGVLRDRGGVGRDAEVTSPTNARRLRLLLTRFQTMLAAENQPS
jgi:4Fe-4S iron-sulfur cluster binding domain/DR2241 stabilising domain